MKMCFDLDGTIAKNKVQGQDYSEVEPMSDVVETMKALKSVGHYLIIYTARNMNTFNNNIGRITAVQAPIILEWLKKWGIPYDELIFGKPNADIFIDDKGFKFTNWKEIKSIFGESNV